MARIPYFDMETASPELRDLVGSRPPLNIYRMLSHAGPAAIGFLRMGSAILRENEIDSQLRELAILRVGILCHAPYEVHQHRRVAAGVGVPAVKIDAVTQGADSDAFDDLERLVLRYTDAVVRDVKAPTELFDAVHARLGDRAMAELTLTIGFYMMVSRFLENFEVDIEPPGTIPDATQMTVGGRPS